ncbi:MAG: pirin family protein [Pseudomonadota bacterium]
MVIMTRRADERGRQARDWFEKRLSFSHGDYYDPRYLGFGALRVLNENHLAPGAAFDAAQRSDLEILSVVCDGRLRHTDSLGNERVVETGGVQRLSAGAGVEYRAANADPDAPLHFFQIWVLPDRRGGRPRYDEARFPDPAQPGGLRLLASAEGRRGSLSLRRDVDLHAGALRPGESLAHPLGPEREVWLQVASGSLTAGEERLTAGDGMGLAEIEVLRLAAETDATFLLFDMARD